jgi:hypothetical protein
MLAFRKPRAAARAQVFALLVGLPLAAAATPCMYRGLDADARVINRSGEISTPFPVSMSSNDCRRLRVASGTVAVYVATAQGALGTPLQVSRGPLVPSTDAGPVGASDIGILKQIVVVLEGVNRTKNGSSRGAEGDYLVASLPVGHLAEPAADLALELGPVPDLNFASFELLVGGKTVHRQSGPTQWIKLPLAILKPGASVRWKLDYSGSKYEGAFVVEPAATLDALKQSLAKDAPADADELVGKLRIAAGLNLQGYAWDARALIRSVLSP